MGLLSIFRPRVVKPKPSIDNLTTTNRLILRLCAAAAAAEDRLSDLPDNDDLVAMLRAAQAEAEQFFPPTTYVDRDFSL